MNSHQRRIRKRFLTRELDNIFLDIIKFSNYLQKISSWNQPIYTDTRISFDIHKDHIVIIDYPEIILDIKMSYRPSIKYGIRISKNIELAEFIFSLNKKKYIMSNVYPVTRLSDKFILAPDKYNFNKIRVINDHNIGSNRVTDANSILEDDSIPEEIKKKIIYNSQFF